MGEAKRRKQILGSAKGEGNQKTEDRLYPPGGELSKRTREGWIIHYLSESDVQESPQMQQMKILLSQKMANGRTPNYNKKLYYVRIDIELESVYAIARPVVARHTKEILVDWVFGQNSRAVIVQAIMTPRSELMKIIALKLKKDLDKKKVRLSEIANDISTGGILWSQQ